MEQIEIVAQRMESISADACAGFHNIGMSVSHRWDFRFGKIASIGQISTDVDQRSENLNVLSHRICHSSSRETAT